MSALYDLVRDSALFSAGVFDWFDMLVLAWLIYRALLFLRGTRALQSLLGIGFLAAVYVSSDYLGLTTIHWLLDKVFVWVALALIILFQEDIRRALARAGGTIFGRTTRGLDAQVMEEVVQVAFALAHRKIGALIAIERTASLEPFTEGAHPVDGRVTAELLQCLFHPSSPLHDGAVIISQRRVLAAGAFLPLGAPKETGRQFGTRHRAAIGLTEATDAMCVAVSEERGTVAVVQNGVVTPVADANDLRQRLQEGLVSGRIGATAMRPPVAS